MWVLMWVRVFGQRESTSQHHQDPRTLICLPTHIFENSWRRGNPMKVIDDCLVLPMSGKRTRRFFRSPHTFLEQQKKQMYLRKQKNLNFIEVWWVQHWLSWVELSTSVTKVLNSTHDKQCCTQIQLMVFTWGPECNRCPTTQTLWCTGESRTRKSFLT